jgi:protein-S-isoprenylcysteine O-methyltransferase Ste14
MSLREEIEKQGNWLFRYRGYIPLLLLPLVIVALKDSEFLEKHFGDSIDDTWEIFCLGISFFGLFIRCITIGYVPKGTSGRNTDQQRADRLNTTGMYSIVRHPLYLGNFLIMLGIMMFTQVGWIVLISVLAFWLYYERIIFAEEEFLRKKYGGIFVEWAERTPAFFPALRRWQRPELPFSFRTVLRREYTGLFVITLSFTALEVVGDIIADGRVEMDTEWIAFFTAGLIFYLSLRTLKKKTGFLDVEGR